MRAFTILTLLLATALCHAGEKHVAKHSQFSADQLVEYLELIGGNWDAEFDEDCYVAFVFSSTAKDGKAEKDYYWSTDPSKHHKILFMHDISGEVQRGRQVIHRMRMHTTQIGVWKELVNGVRTKSTIGGGHTRNEIVPDSGSSRYAIKDLQFTIGDPVQIYTWKCADSLSRFTVELLFATNKNKAEQDGADQPATAPESKSEGKEKPKPEAEGRSQ